MSQWRADFPAINQHLERIYFDNAATMQKSQAVIDVRVHYESDGRSALGRTSGQLAHDNASQYQKARKSISQYFGMKPAELILTPSATIAANYLALNLNLFTRETCPQIALALANHSSVLAPFFSLQANGQANITLLPPNEQGRVDQLKLSEVLANPQIRLLVLPSTSNVFGCHEDLAYLSQLIQNTNKKREKKLFFAFDAAASCSESELNFARLQLDFVILSAHKMGGPMLGALGVKKALLEQNMFMPVFIGGGNVDFDQQKERLTLINDKTERFNAGVFDLASLLEWEAACNYYRQDKQVKINYLRQLTQQLVKGLSSIKGIKILGSGMHGHLVSFTYEPYNYHDVIAYLAANNVCARAGTHCAQLLHHHLGIEGSIRLSLAIYNTEAEVAKVLSILENLPRTLKA